MEIFQNSLLKNNVIEQKIYKVLVYYIRSGPLMFTQGQ